MEKQKITKNFYWSVFHIVSYYNAKMHAMHTLVYGEKRRHFQKRVFWVFMSLLGTNTLKSMESTLYGKRKQQFQKKTCLISVFELRTKFLKGMKKKHFCINGAKFFNYFKFFLIFYFFSLLCTRFSKTDAKFPIWW